MKKLFILILISFSGASIAAAQSPARSMASVRQTLRVEHAKELMGPRYDKSIISKVAEAENVESNIYKVVYKSLPKAYRKQARDIAITIINEAQAHSFDPYFIMAVISGESSFNPKTVGPVGEIGLMQIRMKTGAWMAGIQKSKWHGKKTLRNPIANIKLGVAYLAWLREKFDGHGQLYVAAYNMGARNVNKALSRKVYPKVYPIRVMKRYIAFYKEIGRQSDTL